MMKNWDINIPILLKFYENYCLLLDIISNMQYCLLETEVNNIAIKLEKMHFDKDTKDELNKFAET